MQKGASTGYVLQNRVMRRGGAIRVRLVAFWGSAGGLRTRGLKNAEHNYFEK